MTAPTLIFAAATSRSAATPVTNDYGSDVAANDICIISGTIVSNEVAAAFTATGFTFPLAVNPSSSTWTTAFGWKRCDGSEDLTTLSCAMSSGAANRVLSLATYRGCITTGTPYEGLASSNTTTGTTIVAPNLVTTDSDRLGILISSHKDSNATVSGATGWSQDWLDDDHTGSGRQVVGYRQTIASATTITGVTLNYAFSAAGVCIAFALIPATISGPALVMPMRIPGPNPLSRM